MQQEKNHLFNKWSWKKTGQLHAGINGTTFHAIYKNEFKQIKNLSVSPKAIKILEENTGHIFFDTGFSNICFRSVSPVKGNKSKNKQVGPHINLKRLCTGKKIINKLKRQPTEQEKVFTNSISNNGLIFKIYKKNHTT